MPALPPTPTPDVLARGRVAVSVHPEEGGAGVRVELVNLGAEPLRVLQLGPWAPGDDDEPWRCTRTEGRPLGAAGVREAASIDDPDGWIAGEAQIAVGLEAPDEVRLWAALVETRAGARSWVGVQATDPSADDRTERRGIGRRMPAILLAAVALILAVGLGALLVRGPSLTPKPNIVLVVADDMGWSDTSLHGDERFPMPHLERLADEGVRFTQGYATASVCSPSRVALLTGRYQHRIGHEFNPPVVAREGIGLPREAVLLSEHLRAEGYKTAAMGKWHLGFAPSMHPMTRGFQTWFGFLRGERPQLPTEGLPSYKRLYDGRRMVPEDFTTVSDALGARAEAFIRGARRHPFFLYLSFSAVHTPLQAPPEDIAAADPSLQGDRRTLAAMTTAMDRNLGRVLDALEREHVADDTVVFFINDNGGGTRNAANNAPFRSHKGRVYEGGHRVPFVVRWPTTLDPGVYTDPVSTLDVVPTALAAAGVAMPDDLDGVDLIPWLTGEAPRGQRAHEVLYWRLGDSWAVRAGDWKLLSDKGGPPHLYDLVADPGEQHDRIDDEPDRARELQALYTAWSASVAAPAFRGNRDKSVERAEQRATKSPTPEAE